MERRKRWLASLLALVLAVGLLPTAAWAEGCTENLECAADKHTLYCPKNEKNVTRAELAEIIYKNGEGAFQTVNSASTSPAGFSDIRSLKEAQKNAINALANADIIAGTELGTDGNPLFTPDTEVTREQVAVVFWRLTGSKQVPLTENLSFKDVSAVDPFAPAVAAMVSAGLASGMSDDSFGVGQQITVGQVNTLIGRYLGTVDGGTTQAKFDTYKSATTRLDMVREAYAKYKNSPLATVIAPELDYADIGTCSKDEQAMIQFFTTRGIAQGYAPKDENNPVYRFGPYDAVSNLQAAVFLYQCATKFESRSVEASGQLLDGEGDLTAQAISYALNQGGAGEMITAAWNFLEQETGLNLSDYKDNPDTAVLANTVSTWTERLVPERPTITVTNGQAAISTTETDAVIYYTTDGTTPTVESAKYTSEPSVSVPVTQGTTVKAVAVKNSLYSEVATYTAPVLTITPSPTSLTGGGTVTLTVSNIPAGATGVTVICTSHPTIAVSGSGTAWTATLPNADATYTFTVKAGTATDTCTVTVTRRSTSSSGSSSSSSNTTTSTERNPDGSTTTTTTNKTTGTVTETTRYPDGSREVVETKRDGTVTTTSTDADGNQTRVVESPDGSMETAVDNADGTASVTTEDPDGRVTVEAVLPASAVNDAGGEAVALPMPAVRAERDRGDAPTVTVDLPRGASVPVEIPVENAAVSTVALLVHADGTEEIVKTSLATENGVAVSLSDGDTVKIVDNGKTFYDVPGSHWGAEAIDFVTSRELFGGTSAVTFEPERSMNRGMLVTVLYRLENEPNVWGGGSYTDVPEGMYYSSAVAWADGNGIVTGYADAAFAPGRDITREEMAVVLYRYARYKGLDVTASTDLGRYTDADSISAYAQEAMAWTTDYGLVTADTTGALMPRGYATRAQVAAILQRFLYLING